MRRRAGQREARARGVPKMTERKDSNADAMRSFGLLGSVGLSFVIAIVLGAGGGLLIDRWIGSGHWGFFIGFFLGLAAGVVNVVRASKSIK
jgi:ATP synthase protein I